jgi:hypothetical protein
LIKVKVQTRESSAFCPLHKRDNAMAYRDIMVILDDQDTSVACLSAAACLAAKSKASLVGLFLTQAFAYPYIGADYGAYIPSDVIQKLADDHASSQKVHSQAAKKRFVAEVLANGLASEWAEIEIGGPADLYTRARLSDLVVFPKSGMPKFGLSAADLVTGIGGPAVLVPGTAVIKAVGSKILLGWNDSRESANALRGAMPLIHLAGAVTIVCVGENKSGPLQHHLNFHKIMNTVIAKPQTDYGPETILGSEAKSMAADLVVMGLYGHNRLQEFILGGVSRALLSADDPNILLVSH